VEECIVLRTRTIQLAASVIGAFGLVLVAPAAANAAEPADVAAPSVTFTPNTNVVSGTEVVVSVAGFTAGDSVYATVCAEAGDVPLCAWGDSAQVPIDEAGAGAAPLTVRSSFEADGHAVDCATVEGGCYVTAFNDAGTSSAVAPIVFAPAA
jgi:hypothetical protein